MILNLAELAISYILMGIHMLDHLKMEPRVDKVVIIGLVPDKCTQGSGWAVFPMGMENI